MVTLAPAHPVYAAQEDRYERDSQAEAQADACFEFRMLAFRDHLSVLWTQEPERALHIEETVMDALRGLFIAGWDAAREEQRRDGPIVNGERFALGYTAEAAAYEQRTRAKQNR